MLDRIRQECFTVNKSFAMMMAHSNELGSEAKRNANEIESKEAAINVLRKEMTDLSTDYERRIEELNEQFQNDNGELLAQRDNAFVDCKALQKSNKDLKDELIKTAEILQRTKIELEKALEKASDANEEREGSLNLLQNEKDSNLQLKRQLKATADAYQSIVTSNNENTQMITLLESQRKALMTERESLTCYEAVCTQTDESCSIVEEKLQETMDTTTLKERYAALLEDHSEFINKSVHAQDEKECVIDDLRKRLQHDAKMWQDKLQLVDERRGETQAKLEELQDETERHVTKIGHLEHQLYQLEHSSAGDSQKREDELLCQLQTIEEKYDKLKECYNCLKTTRLSSIAEDEDGLQPERTKEEFDALQEIIENINQKNEELQSTNEFLEDENEDLRRDMKIMKEEFEKLITDELQRQNESFTEERQTVQQKIQDEFQAVKDDMNRQLLQAAEMCSELQQQVIQLQKEKRKQEAVT